MAGMWTIALFPVVFLGQRVEARKSRRAALLAVAVASFAVFVGSEAVAWRIPIWHAQKVEGRPLPVLQSVDQAPSSLRYRARPRADGRRRSVVRADEDRKAEVAGIREELRQKGKLKHRPGPHHCVICGTRVLSDWLDLYADYFDPPRWPACPEDCAYLGGHREERAALLPGYQAA